MNLVNFVWAFEFLPDVDPLSGKEIPADLDNFDFASIFFHFDLTLSHRLFSALYRVS
jgi:hypothetical protein